MSHLSSRSRQSVTSTLLMTCAIVKPPSKGCIADPIPAGHDEPAFWFLHDDAYDLEIGLCPTPAMSTMIF